MSIKKTLRKGTDFYYMSNNTIKNANNISIHKMTQILLNPAGIHPSVDGKGYVEDEEGLERPVL